MFTESINLWLDDVDRGVRTWIVRLSSSSDSLRAPEVTMDRTILAVLALGSACRPAKIDIDSVGSADTAADTATDTAAACASVDADGDRYSACEDCDDDDPYINPGAEDYCDGVDNDCSGGIDEAFDDDGDGDSECGTDCDDSDPSAFVGGEEVCDGADNDCNGLVDDVEGCVDYECESVDGYVVCATQVDWDTAVAACEMLDGTLGKVTTTYTEEHFTTILDGETTVTPYEVLASSDGVVVIEYFDMAFHSMRRRRIQVFDDKLAVKVPGLGFDEIFTPVDPPAAPATVAPPTAAP